MNPLVEPLLWFLAPIFLAFYFALSAHLTLKEYKPMSDRLSRALRTAVQAFIGSAIPLIAAKLAEVKGIDDLSGLVTTLIPVATAALSAAVSAAFYVIFPPATPPSI